ncbi:MAG: TAXI family TRAP transporter solute-binding subunit [Sedimentisphaerales bacterium]|nr:TAXI family TRAP transporter solute-binding subunit [Sedimentisphaerales bacterium]
MNRTTWLVVAALVLPSGCKRKDAQFVTIGTGSVTGIYYPTGGAISQMINRKFEQYRIKATVESTSGSVYNVNGVLRGDLDFGTVQSDRQYQAYHGLAEWSGRGPQTSLRSVFSVHPESITLVASEPSGIRAVEDIRGKRVNLGNIGSGHLQNSRDVLWAAGLSEKDLDAEYVRALEAPGLLQDGRIDAFFYTVGHPNSSIEEATFGRIPVRLIPIEGAVAAHLLQEYPYYAASVIPQEHYPQALNSEDIRSIGVKTTFVTAKETPENVVYAITREVFENFDDFKQLHPAYKKLTRRDMLKGLSAPLHPGARTYYREAGLVEDIRRELMEP